MGKAKKQREIESKLTDYNKRLEALDNRKIGEDGRLDFDVVMKMQNLQTDISILEKQLKFVQQGKHYLGQEIGSKNVNKYL